MIYCSLFSLSLILVEIYFVDKNILFTLLNTKYLFGDILIKYVLYSKYKLLSVNKNKK